MEIHVRCPSCKARFKAPGQYAGLRVKCPKCSAPVTLSDEKEAAPPAANPNPRGEVCPQCRAAIPAGETLCPACSGIPPTAGTARLTDAALSPIAAKPTGRRKPRARGTRTIWTAAGAGGVLAIGVLIGILFSRFGISRKEANALAAAGVPAPDATVPQGVAPVVSVDANRDNDLRGTSTVTDPEGNLVGDRERGSIDIIEATVELRNERYCFTVTTAKPFPKREDLTGGKRLDFIWFIDIDRNKATSAFADGAGQDYHVHLFFQESGWGANWLKGDDVARQDGIQIQYNKFDFSAEDRRAGMSFPARYLPSKEFDWWIAATTRNSTNWLPITEHPATTHATFSTAGPEHKAAH